MSETWRHDDDAADAHRALENALLGHLLSQLVGLHFRQLLYNSRDRVQVDFLNAIAHLLLVRQQRHEVKGFNQNDFQKASSLAPDRCESQEVRLDA